MGKILKAPDPPHKMYLIGKDILHEYKADHPETKNDLDAWEAEAKEAEWNNSHELRNRYSKVSIIGGRQVIFNIYGNRYRLWVEINYKNKIVRVVKVGTHKEYDNWDIK